jgi:hypothetical protein
MLAQFKPRAATDTATITHITVHSKGTVALAQHHVEQQLTCSDSASCLA